MVVDQRQLLTITPNAGTIKLAIVGSLWGSVAVGQGTITAMAPKFNGTTDLTAAWQSTQKSMLVPTTWYVSAFDTVASAAPTQTGDVPFGLYKAVKYRTLSNVGSIMYTGSSLANSGYGRVYRTYTSGLRNTTNTTVNTQSLPLINYSDIISTVQDSQYKTFPASQPIAVRNVAAKPEFQDIPEYTVSSYIAPFATTSGGGGTSDMPWPGLDSTFPITVIEYSGLDSTASITVEMKTCLEIQPITGSFAGLTKASPPTDIGLWSTLAKWARDLPVAELGKLARNVAYVGASDSEPDSIAALADRMVRMYVDSGGNVRA